MRRNIPVYENREPFYTSRSQCVLQGKSLQLFPFIFIYLFIFRGNTEFRYLRHRKGRGVRCCRKSALTVPNSLGTYDN